MEKQHYPFKLIPLPYAYNALEPYIDAQTMELHHDRHLKTYVENLNAVLERHPEYHEWDLQKLLVNVNWLPPDIRTKVRRNAGGVYNHEFFFSHLTSDVGVLKGRLKDMLDSKYGSFDNFKKEFKTAALAVFGSGYTWLVGDKNGELRIQMTQNQDTPLESGLNPIICIDVWEHSYYLKHHNLRGDYIEDWFEVANWEKAEQNLVTQM